MILKNKLANEKGFLLIESLVGLSILSLLILVLYPLIVDWLLLVETEKEKVEISRVLYEASFSWSDATTDKTYRIQQNNQSLTVSDPKNKVGVSIYETHFE